MQVAAIGAGEVLGVCCWEEMSGAVLYVEELFSVVRRGGLAAGAIGEAMRQCAGGRGAARVELQVHTRNKEAARYYGGLGMTPCRWWVEGQLVGGGAYCRLQEHAG